MKMNLLIKLLLPVNKPLVYYPKKNDILSVDLCLSN